MYFVDMYISILHFTGTKYCVKILTVAKRLAISITCRKHYYFVKKRPATTLVRADITGSRDIATAPRLLPSPQPLYSQIMG